MRETHKHILRGPMSICPLDRQRAAYAATKPLEWSCCSIISSLAFLYDWLFFLLHSLTPHVCLLKYTCCCLNMFKPNFVRSLARFNATRPSHRNDLPWVSTHFLWGLLLTDVPLQATVPTKMGKLLVMVPFY